ncbi:MAG TPA: NAD(P)-dependent oxidoreductase [Euzebyales bacterium]
MSAAHSAFRRPRDDTQCGDHMSDQHIGFIGLGIMGRGMSRNLLDAGFGLTVWNRTGQRAEAIVDAGATWADAPAAVADAADIVIICVSDTPDVEQVLTGDDGVIHGATPGTLVVDCSTISPATTRALASTLAERDIAMLDAPISGGSEGAAQGTLSIMVGGPAEQFERARPVLDAMGQTITHVGEEHGAGQAVKLVNQILVVHNMLGVSEAMLLAEAEGLDLERTLAAVSGGAAGSWMLSNRGPQVAARDWSPGFTIDLQQKDLRLVLEAFERLQLPAVGTALISQLYATLQRRGLGGEGNHALVRALEHLAGVRVGG